MKRKNISRAVLIAVIFGSASGAANATTIATKGYVDGAVNMLTSVDASMYNSLQDKANTADVNTALAAKADTTTVNTALATKANTADVTTAIATATNDMATQTWVGTQGYVTSTDISGKADTTDVDTQLATKANTADVTTALATKADVTALDAKANTADVTTALATKADVTALDAKANTADVTTALATKADVTALDAKANTADVTTAITTATTDMATQTWVGTQGYLTTAGVADKADKIVPATAGNLAGLDASGNLIDSGVSAESKADTTYVDTQLATKANAADVTISLAAKADTTYVDTGLAAKASTADVTTAITTATTDMATQTWVGTQGYLTTAGVADKADKIVPATAGNLAGLDASGNLIDSGVAAGNVASASDLTALQGTVTTLSGTVDTKQDKLVATAANQLLVSTDAAGGATWVSLTPDTFGE